MLIYFEGIDGVGKSTQISALKQKNPNCICTHEPGATPLGKNLREILLHQKISSRAEILLFLADRAEHYAKILSQNKNKLVLSDRGFVSGLAYAMASQNYDIKELLMLNSFALQGDFDAKFIFFKADEKLIKNRLMLRANSDSIEERGIEYLLRVQEFMQIILKDLDFCYLQVNANDEINAISKQIEKFIKG